MIATIQSKHVTPDTTPTPSTVEVFFHVAHSTLTPTLPAAEADMTEAPPVSIWTRLYLWTPYVIFTLCLLALSVASFIQFHRKHGHKYRRRRSDIWRDLDMASLFDNMQLQVSPPPRQPTDQSTSSNGGPELQSLLATCPKPKRQRKEPIKFASNLNGSMIDVRYTEEPQSSKADDVSSAPPTDFALVQVRGSGGGAGSRHRDRADHQLVTSNTGGTTSAATAVGLHDAISSKRPLDVVTTFNESPRSSRGGGGEYQTRAVDKKPSLRAQPSPLALVRTNTDGDDVIRLVLRGGSGSDASAPTSSSARPARVSLPAKEPAGYYGDGCGVTQPDVSGPTKLQRTLPSHPSMQLHGNRGLVAQTSRGRQLPQPPARV